MILRLVSELYCGPNSQLLSYILLITKGICLVDDMVHKLVQQKARSLPPLLWALLLKHSAWHTVPIADGDVRAPDRKDAVNCLVLANGTLELVDLCEDDLCRRAFVILP